MIKIQQKLYFGLRLLEYMQCDPLVLLGTGELQLPISHVITGAETAGTLVSVLAARLLLNSTPCEVLSTATVGSAVLGGHITCIFHIVST